MLTLTFNSLSKSYRSCGYRAGWLVVSGDKETCQGLHRRFEHAVEHAPVRQRARAVGHPDRAGRFQSINDLVCEGGRLRGSAIWRMS